MCAEWCLYDYWLGISIHGKLAQQRNTHLKCGNSWCDGGYEHIFPWPYQMLFDSYDNHAESKTFICLKEAISHFTKPSVWCISDFYFIFLNNNPTSNNMGQTSMFQINLSNSTFNFLCQKMSYIYFTILLIWMRYEL